MTVSVLHAFTSPDAQGTNPNKVYGPQWNAEHTITGLDGVDLNVLNPVSAAHAIVPADNGTTIYATGGLFTITLGAVTGFPTNGVVTIINGDSTRGKLLSGFPSEVFAILYPRQTVQVKVVNSVWAASINPGKWNAPTAVTVHVDHTNGSDTISDGLSTTTGAFATIVHAYQMLQSQINGPIGTIPVIQVDDTAFTETPSLALSGAPNTGVGVVTIKGNAASPQSCVWTSSGITINNGVVLSLNGFTTRTPGSSQDFLSVAKGGICAAINMIWSTCTGGSHIVLYSGGVFASDVGTYQVGDATSGANTMTNHVKNLGGSWQQPLAVTCSVPNALTVPGAWYLAGGAGAACTFLQAMLFTGTGSAGGSTGKKYALTDNATFISAGTVFPGATAGTATSGASVDGVMAPITGTTAADSAIAGNVGEYVESVLVSGSAVSLVTATAKTITSISLTAGDWDVDCVFYAGLGATTSLTAVVAGLSQTTNTLDITAGRWSVLDLSAVVPGAVNCSNCVPPYRFSLSGTTTIYLIGQANFTVSTAVGWGIIRARRVR